MAAPLNGAAAQDGEQQQPVQQQSVFPPPPPYYKLWRPDADGTAERPLPPDPPPPADGTYQMFGELHSTESGVPPLQVRRLYEVTVDGTIDFREELRRCNQEVLFGFIELLGALTERPSAYARQLEAVGIALRNQLHLCNLLRPHQARATLEHLLEVEVDEKQRAIADVRHHAEDAQAQLQRYAEQLVDPP